MDGLQSSSGRGSRRGGRRLVAGAFCWTAGLGLVRGLAGVGASDSSPELPPPAAEPVDFVREVQPIFEAACVRCHGPDRARSGYRLDARETALGAGDNNDQNILPGDSANSPLIRYVARVVEDMEMPPEGQGEPLTAEQVGILRRWVDDGAAWGEGTIGRRVEPVFSVTPSVTWIGVSGNAGRFREHWWRTDGWSGGLDRFELVQPLGDGSVVTAEGRALAEQNEYRVALELRKPRAGFVGGGFEVGRRWFDDLGGYYEPFEAAPPRLGRDLYLDVGRAWFEAGLTRPDLPEIVAGYEYQFRDGSRSTLQWGQWAPDPTVQTPKGVYPTFKEIDEATHLLKLDVRYEVGGVLFEDNFRTEFHDQRTVRVNQGEGSPDILATHDEEYDHTRLANTFRVEKQLRDGVFASGGYLYARLDGQGAFQQAFESASFGSFAGDASRRLALDQESHVANGNLRFGPWQRTTLSAGLQADWLRQDGLSDLLVPGFPDPFEAGYGSNLRRLALDERLGLKFEGIPLSVLYADARLRQEWTDHAESGEVMDGFADSQDFARDTEDQGRLWDVVTGVTFSPVVSASVDAYYRYRNRQRRYDHRLDTDGSDPSLGVPGNGYPAFIEARDAVGDEVGVRWVNRWARWMRTTARVEFSQTDYETVTDGSVLFGFPDNTLLPGGFLLAGREEATTVSLNATLTPFRRWYFSITGNYRESDLVSGVTDGVLVVPYSGETFSLLGSVSYILTRDTDLRASYSFSHALYRQDNVASLPLGMDYDRHGLIVGVSRRLKEGLTMGLNYGFFDYAEPTAGGAADYTAHAVFATVSATLK